MLKYIGRRILQMIPVFLGVTVLLFALTTIVPGDPVKMITGERAISPEVYQQIRMEYGFDKPLYVQYGMYLNRLLHGDLGSSLMRHRAVKDMLFEKFPYTARLALAAILIEIIIGIGAGMISAVKRYSLADVLVTLSTSILVSLPVFWLGTMLQLFFGIYLKHWTNNGFYLPMSGLGGPDAPFPSWTYLILPAITLASVSTAYAARIMRSQLLEVMNQDYIRTATAKGLTASAVLWRHALKNAMIPVVTFIGIDFGALMSGAILTETVFNWPGVGNEIFNAVSRRDWPVVMGGVAVIVVLVMVINLIVDVSYAFFDPRIRYGGTQE